MKEEIYIVNQKWHEPQEERRYIDEIKKCERIEIITSLNNRYYYYRKGNSPETRYENTWNVEKNGKFFREETFTTMDNLMLPFYERVDPVTLRPIEVPEDAYLR